MQEQSAWVPFLGALVGAVIGGLSGLLVAWKTGQQRLREMRQEWESRGEEREEQRKERNSLAAVEAVSRAIGFTSQLQTAVFSPTPTIEELDARFSELRAELIRIRVAHPSEPVVQAAWSLETQLTLALFTLSVGGKQPKATDEANSILRQAGRSCDELIRVFREDAGLTLQEPLDVTYEEIFGREP